MRENGELIGQVRGVAASRDGLRSFFGQVSRGSL